jgi:hypothetical protein
MLLAGVPATNDLYLHGKSTPRLQIFGAILSFPYPTFKSLKDNGNALHVEIVVYPRPVAER